MLVNKLYASPTNKLYNLRAKRKIHNGIQVILTEKFFHI